MFLVNVLCKKIIILTLWTLRNNNERFIIEPFSAHAPLNCLHWIHPIREWLGRVAKEARERVLVWYVSLNAFKNSAGQHFQCLCFVVHYTYLLLHLDIIFKSLMALNMTIRAPACFCKNPFDVWLNFLAVTFIFCW